MEISFTAAFIAGVLTFFATCLIPIIPVYVGYLGGITVVSGGSGRQTATIIIHGAVFVLAFLLVFSTLGLAATAAGPFIAQYREPFRMIGGMFLVLLGLTMADVVRIPILSHTIQFQPKKIKAGSVVTAFVLGLTFGSAWTPCIGPVLAVILFMVSQTATLWYGASLLAVFAIGLGLPFIIVSVLYALYGFRLSHLGSLSRFIRILFALLMVLMGVLLVTGYSAVLSQWSLKWGGSLVL